MLHLFLAIAIGAIVCCYVSRHITESRRRKQHEQWQEFLHKMSLTGRIVDDYYQPFSAGRIMGLMQTAERPTLKNELDALYLTPDIIVKVSGRCVTIEHRPAFYEQTATIG